MHLGLCESGVPLTPLVQIIILPISSNYNSHNWPIVVIIFRHSHFTVEVSAMVPMVPNVLPEVTMSFPICQKFREKRPGWQLEAPKPLKAPEAPEVADGWCMLCTMTIRHPAQWAWSNGARNPLDSTGLFIFGGYIMVQKNAVFRHTHTSICCSAPFLGRRITFGDVHFCRVPLWMIHPQSTAQPPSIIWVGGWPGKASFWKASPR